MTLAGKEKGALDSDPLLNRLGQLVSSQRSAALATAGCTTPYLNLVASAASQDLQRVWFATPRGARKHANLRTNCAFFELCVNRSSWSTRPRTSP